MDTNSMFGLMDLIVAGGGIYVIYQYIMMVKTRKVQNSALLPKEIDPKKCKDTEGYINYIGPKMLAFGIVATICGAVGLIQDYTGKIGPWVYMLGIVVFVLMNVIFLLKISVLTKVILGFKIGILTKVIFEFKIRILTKVVFEFKIRFLIKVIF